jgi:hypothetical protein
MRWLFPFSRSRVGLRFAIFAPLPVVALALSATATERIRLAPKFTRGETLRYQIDTRTTTTGKTTTPIADPEGGSKASQTIRLLVRLDVLAVEPGTPGAQGPVRLSATYEKSWAHSETDAFDPQTPSLEDRYARLEGHSIEFTIGPSGQAEDFEGWEDIRAQQSELNPLLSWAKGLSLGSGFPKRGIAIGEKWRSERPLAGGPLSDLLWRTESSYLRNEPCSSSPPSAPGGASPAIADTCAMVLTRFEILRHGSPKSDATPEEYRRNGLRTLGSWKGAGESLDSISIASGLLVSSTQSSTQDMDYQIVSATTGEAIHQVGHVQSQSDVRLEGSLPRP